MRYILLSILVFLSVFIGYLFSKKYRNRKNFFQALVLLCNKFDIEINYSRERVKNIFDLAGNHDLTRIWALDSNDFNYLKYSELARNNDLKSKIEDFQIIIKEVGNFTHIMMHPFYFPFAPVPFDYYADPGRDFFFFF